MIKFKEYVERRDALNESLTDKLKMVVMKGVSRVFQIGAPVAAIGGAALGGVAGLSQWEWFLSPHNIFYTILSVLVGLVAGGVVAHEALAHLSDLAEEVAKKLKDKLDAKQIASKEQLRSETERIAKEILSNHAN